MNDLAKQLQFYNSQKLKQKKTWYSSAANAYNQARPRYPEKIINRVVELTKITRNGIILELGCGPGNATLSFAKQGFTMICVELNQDFCQLAKHNCSSYENVKIINSSFEEWKLESGKFDAVLAANSFHWLSPEIAYTKAAQALHKNGWLIQLWNMNTEPDYEVYQLLQPVYQNYAPHLDRYEGKETQKDIQKSLGEMIINSGKFIDLLSEHLACELTYSVDDYLTLLSTFSPYLKLEEHTRKSLFSQLREKINQDLGGKITLYYLCAFHIARNAG